MPEYESLAHRYREIAVMTASPLQLIVILYDAAICSVQEARKQMDCRDIAGRSRSINKCIAIISELQSCLNTESGGEIAVSLDRLYDYIKRTVFLATVNQDHQPLIEIESLLDNLRSAWAELANQASAATTPASQQLAPAIYPKPLNISI